MTNLELFLLSACISLIAVTALTMFVYSQMYKTYRKFKKEISSTTLERNALRLENSELQSEILQYKLRKQQLNQFLTERMQTAYDLESHSAYFVMREAFQKILQLDQ